MSAARSTCAVAWLLLIGVAAAEPADRSAPTERGQPSPLTLPDGLTAELVACEPDVIDPVAIRFDERGRLWVVEMRDYPLGPQNGDPPDGRIRILSDEDGDGRFESPVVFAEGLLMPTGVQPYRDGGLVTVAGKLLFLRDTDGDGRADTSETWLTGLAEDNEQLRTNHPTIGPDGWLHLANGLRTVAVTDVRFADSQPVTVRGRDFRLHLTEPRLEPVSGHGQHGMTFDRWGHRFVCSNARPLDFGVIPAAAADRDPLLRSIRTVAEVVPGGQGRPVHPLVKQFTTSIKHTGSFTAACGVCVPWATLTIDAFAPSDSTNLDWYEDRFRGVEQDVFICEPTGALIHRETLRPAGATFSARPGRRDRAFAASTDSWFRPVDLVEGPDGCLYACDFYRATIEHPQWMNEELRARTDFQSGNDRGRIYRISPGERMDWQPFGEDDDLPQRLADAKTSWEGLTAARLLADAADEDKYKDTDTVWSRLLALSSPRGPSSETIRIGCLLTGLGRMTPAPQLDELPPQEERGAEIESKVTEQAVAKKRAFELLTVELSPWRDDAPLRTLEQVVERTDDVGVATALMLHLGELAAVSDDPLRYEPATLELAAKFLPKMWPVESYRWFGEALLCSGDAYRGELLMQSLAFETEPVRASQLKFLQRLAEQVARRELREAGEQAVSIEPFLRREASAAASSEAALWARAFALLGACDGGLAGTIRDAAAKSDATAAAIQASLDLVDSSDRVELLDDAGEAPTGVARLHGWLADDAADLTPLWESADPAIRGEALAILSQRPDLSVPPAWVAELPKLRATESSLLIDALVTTPSRAGLLLDAIEAGTVPPHLVDALRAKQLRSHPDAAIAERAASLLPTLDDLPDDVWAAYLAALDPQRDSQSRRQHGQAMFAKHCANCHRVSGTGGYVGPELSDLRTKSRSQVLEAILKPNAAIDAAYVAYVARTDRGRLAQGIVVQETAAAVTLRGADGRDVSLARDELDAFQSTGRSLMPERFDRTIPPGDMADLVHWLKTWRFETIASEPAQQR